MNFPSWNPYWFINSEIASEYVGAEEKLQWIQFAVSLFISANEGNMITGTGGRIIDVNEAFSRITGYNHDEVPGCDPNFLSSSRHDKKFFADMRNGLIEQGHCQGEVRNQRKNGEVHAEIQTISSVRDFQDPSTNVTQFRGICIFYLS